MTDDDKALVERLRDESIVGMPMENEAADRIEAQAAEIERLREALLEMFEVVCGETGFAQAVRADSGFAYPWPALDLAEAKARAALEETLHVPETCKENGETFT